MDSSGLCEAFHLIGLSRLSVAANAGICIVFPDVQMLKCFDGHIFQNNKLKRITEHLSYALLATDVFDGSAKSCSFDEAIVPRRQSKKAGKPLLPAHSKVPEFG